ncbi:caffeic acid 3-O-methyltransferase-like [Prunus avium]|uniref:caffeate O-methyltransferase n=1 Tax=Prunus avium TaxID=42229 RepID=A0A6P5T674_PRUAV|nr:caffeic acid 3-O-methyltransferase-like [Prunus avium]
MASSLERKRHPKINHVETEDEITKEEEEESLCYALQLVGSYALSISLQLAIELGVFDIIAKEGPGAKLSSSKIAAKIGTKNSEAPMMMDRILRLLTSHSVLHCSLVAANEDENGASDFQRAYSLGPVSKYFVNDEEGGSLGPFMALTQDKVCMETWSQLKDAVVEGGIPFNMAHGMPTFEFLGSDPRFNQVFNTAMFNQTTIVIKKLLHIYKGFQDKNLTQLVDVGGGFGVTLNLITSRYPHIRGINYDLPHVVNHAPSYPGVEHVGGDMFASVPSGDAIFMKSILHDWSDEHCLKLLKNCYKAIPDNGKVIVVGALLPAMPDTRTAVKSTSQFDVMMMTHVRGGKERSEQELMALATGAGFSGIRYECFVCNLWVMEFFK